MDNRQREQSLLIDVINFLHVTTITGLFGLCTVAWLNAIRTHWSLKTPRQCLGVDYLLLSLMLIAGISGAILVTPKGFMLTTPWIQAAYKFLSLSFILLLTQVVLRNIMLQRGQNTTGPLFKGYLIGNYSTLLLLFIIIIQDAVAKQTIWALISNGI